MGCTPKQMAKSMYLAIDFAEKQSHLVSEARQVRTTARQPPHASITTALAASQLDSKVGNDGEVGLVDSQLSIQYRHTSAGAPERVALSDGAPCSDRKTQSSSASAAGLVGAAGA
jgi:hypothetical protein